MRIRSRVVAALVAPFVLMAAECGGKGSTNPDGDGNGLPKNATVHLEIRGLTGNEGAMEVRYTIASTAITRAAESVIPRASQLAYCVTVGSTGSCDITVPVGKVVSFYAYEGYEGAYFVTTAPITIPKAAHEFVTFSGDCSEFGGLLHGDCGTLATQEKTYNVRADFTSMPEYRVMIHGATAFGIDVTMRELLQMPVRTANPAHGNGGGLVGAPTLSAQGWYPFGTEIKLTASATVNSAKFIRWEGCKAGTGGTNIVCIIAQAVSGGPPTIAKDFHEYWQCPFSVADGPNINCNKVTP